MAVAVKNAMTLFICPMEVQKEKRKGIDKGRNIFNKSRARLRPKLSEMRKEIGDPNI